MKNVHKISLIGELKRAFPGQCYPLHLNRLGKESSWFSKCFLAEKNSVIFLFTRRIAGLNDKKAKAILAWREENGAFINREQLKLVKGIGLKSYEQCVGFVRIVNASGICSNASKPSTSGLSSSAVVVLDSDEENMTGRGKKRKSENTEGGAKKKKKTENGTQTFSADPLDMTWIHPESYPVAKR